MVSRIKTHRYEVRSGGNAAFYLITRLSDGAEVFLQGDDASAFDCLMDWVDGTDDAELQDIRCDDACSAYDTVMRVAAV